VLKRGHQQNRAKQDHYESSNNSKPSGIYPEPEADRRNEQSDCDKRQGDPARKGYGAQSAL